MCSHVQPSVREGGTREEIRYGAWEVDRRRGDDRVTTSKQQQTATYNNKQQANSNKQCAKMEPTAVRFELTRVTPIDF